MFSSIHLRYVLMNKSKDEMSTLVVVPVLTLLVTFSSPSPAPADGNVCTGASRYFASLNSVLSSSHHSCSEVTNSGVNRFNISNLNQINNYSFSSRLFLYHFCGRKVEVMCSRFRDWQVLCVEKNSSKQVYQSKSKICISDEQVIRSSHLPIVNMDHTKYVRKSNLNSSWLGTFSQNFSYFLDSLS